MSVIGKNYGKPTLDLNFAGNKSLIDTTTGRNYVTFTRAQSGNEATYVGSDGLIKYASADEPRFDHDPVTGESLGLLIEESRTNLLRYSEQFNNNTWNKPGVVVSAVNSTLAPDGTTTADTISNVLNTFAWFGQNLSLSNSLTYTLSFYVKPLTESKIIAIESGNGVNTLNLSTLTATNFSGSAISQILPINNGWYRVSFSVSGITNCPIIYIASVYGTAPWNVNVSFAFWGAQLEEGSFPTSYIPTSGSTETRAADEASITGTNFSSWYNQNKGTWFANSSKFATGPSLQQTIIAPFYGSRFGEMTFRPASEVNPGHASFYSTLTGSKLSSTPLSEAKFAASYEDGVGGSYEINSGDLSYTFSSSISIGIPSYLTIGNFTSGSYYLNGHISRLTYYPKRLPDIELQQLTK